MKKRRIVWIFIVMLLLMPLVSGQARSNLGSCFVAPGGDDLKTCSNEGVACATINGALGKVDCIGTIFVASGTYLGTGVEPVVSITRSIALSGGWDPTFTTQSGTSTIDGEETRRGLVVINGVTAFVERFTVSRGRGDGAAGITNNGTLTLDECTVTANVDIGDATSEGGGIRNANTGTLFLLDSTVSDNQSSSGAGLFNAWGDVYISNSTISGNTARGTGGGINNLGGTIYLNNATITDNRDNEISKVPVAGGIHNEAGGKVELRNTILVQNNSGGPDCNGTISSAGFNLIGNSTNCNFIPGTGDRLDNMPRLSALADNGGPTATHALQFGSPAINRGDPAGCRDHQGSPLYSDQRGFLRVQRCDIGAFEYQIPLNEVYLPSLMK